MTTSEDSTSQCGEQHHLYGACTKRADHVAAGDPWHRDGSGTCWRDYEPGRA